MHDFGGREPLPTDEKSTSPSLGVNLHGAVTIKKTAARMVLRNGALGFAKLVNKDMWDEPVVAMFKGHIEVVRVMKSPRMRVAFHDFPWLVYRYFGTYLAKSISKKGRREILKSHYLFLLSRVNDTFFDQIVRSRATLWSTTLDGNLYAVTLSFGASNHYEGDLVMSFEMNSTPLYLISFSIAPGKAVGTTACMHAVLAARVQGAASKMDAIRLASKTFGGIPLPHLLLCGVQGVALALDIPVIAGVKNKEQLTAVLENEPVWFDYDAFWRTFKGTENEQFFLIPVQSPERPNASALTSQRTRAKRLSKFEITESAKLYVANHFLIGCSDP